MALKNSLPSNKVVKVSVDGKMREKGKGVLVIIGANETSGASNQVGRPPPVLSLYILLRHSFPCAVTLTSRHAYICIVATGLFSSSHTNKFSRFNLQRH